MPVSPQLPLSAIRQPAFLYGPDGRVTAANDIAESLAGRSLAGYTATDIIAIFGNRHPDGTPFTQEELPPSRALAGVEAIEVPITVTVADGRTVHILVTASPIREGDEIAGALVVWQDVSALEAALAEQERLHLEAESRTDELASVSSERGRHRPLLDTILGTLPYRISLWDRDERLVWANEQFATVYGEPREALLGRSWREFWGTVAAVEPLVREGLDAIMDGTRVTREVEVPGPAGPEWRACTFLPFGRDALLVITEDITERKEAAAELERLTRQIAAERDRLATILDAIPDAISIHDRDDRYVYVNPALTSAARAASEDILGRSWPERGLDLDRIAPLTNAVHEAFASGEPRTAIYECPVDGAARTYHALAVPLRDARGVVAQVIVSSRDITHILETEAALRESEEWLRLAQESAHIAVWDRDVRTGVVAHTPEFLRLYGLETDAVDQYEAWQERVHPDDIGRLESERDAALVRGESFDTEFRIVLPSGETRWLQAIGRGVVDESGTLVRVLGVNIDITARKAAAEVLAETVEQYHQALNNSLLGYALCEIVTDGAGRPRDFVYLDVNPAFEAFTGLARDRVLNRRVTEILVPAEVAQLIQVYGNVALTGAPRTFQYSIPSLGRSYEVAAFSPKHGRFIAFFTDITARKEAELELEQNAASLRRSNEELLRFAYVASHDLQEPLRPIISFSQLLERRYKGKLDADADDYINFIVEGGKRMQSLIQDLLQFSRLETRALPLTPTDAAEAVADALRLLETSLREANGTVEVGALPTVLADRRQLEQIFVNLIGNAIKYRRPDVPLRIRVAVERRGGMVEFTVADNGIGIEAEYFDRIFEMFRRLHTHDQYGGTGIGLAVVKKIVERHGGSIRVESTPGQGSTFVFTLPAA